MSRSIYLEIHVFMSGCVEHLRLGTPGALLPIAKAIKGMEAQQLPQF